MVLIGEGLTYAVGHPLLKYEGTDHGDCRKVMRTG